MTGTRGTMWKNRASNLPAAALDVVTLIASWPPPITTYSCSCAHQRQTTTTAAPCLERRERSAVDGTVRLVHLEHLERVRVQQLWRVIAPA